MHVAVKLFYVAYFSTTSRGRSGGRRRRVITVIGIDLPPRFHDAMLPKFLARAQTANVAIILRLRQGADGAIALRPAAPCLAMATGRSSASVRAVIDDITTTPSAHSLRRLYRHFWRLASRPLPINGRRRRGSLLPGATRRAVSGILGPEMPQQRPPAFS